MKKARKKPGQKRRPKKTLGTMPVTDLLLDALRFGAVFGATPKHERGLEAAILEWLIQVNASVLIDRILSGEKLPAGFRDTPPSADVIEGLEGIRASIGETGAAVIATWVAAQV